MNYEYLMQGFLRVLCIFSVYIWSSCLEIQAKNYFSNFRGIWKKLHHSHLNLPLGLSINYVNKILPISDPPPLHHKQLYNISLCSTLIKNSIMNIFLSFKVLKITFGFFWILYAIYKNFLKHQNAKGDGWYFCYFRFPQWIFYYIHGPHHDMWQTTSMLKFKSYNSNTKI